jgi:hypothetical protein
MNIASEILRDERGNLSAARTFLFASLLFTAVLIVLDSTIWTVPESVYTLLGSLSVGLLAWAAGPRMAQYIGPQIGAVASGIAQAVKSPQRPELLDSEAPILVNSWYRDPAYNKAVGGVSHSMHLTLGAADIVKVGWPPAKVADLLEHAPHKHMLGIGRYKSFTHIDIRGMIGRPAPARWGSNE